MPWHLLSKSESCLSRLPWNQHGVKQADQRECCPAQVDSLFRVNHTDPWVRGDPYRTSRTISLQVCTSACLNLKI